MNKREFLKSSGVLVAGSMLSKSAAAQAMAEGRPADTRTNWSGNYTYSTDHLDLPRTEEEVQHMVTGHPHLKALGARHSFNGIADSTEDQISLKSFDQMELNEAARTVTVGAGVKYGQLAPYIDAKGYAVHNLASLPHISVVGACATGTHGSGLRNRNLSSVVRAMEMVTASGDVVTLSRETLGDRFAGTVVGLGAYGVITKITLEVEPRFEMDQVVYENLSFSQLEHNLPAIFGTGYSLSLFTDWQKHRATEVWIKRKVDAARKKTGPDSYAKEFYGATAATEKMHPIAGHPAEACTDQLGMPGPWYERMPHFKMNFTPSSGKELQTEYFVPIEHGYEAILAVEQLRDRITPHLFVTELRAIAADELWISPAYQQTSMALHFTWKPEWPEVKKILPLIEAKLAPFGPRPHWAKLFTMAPSAIQGRYARMGDWKALVAKYDPQGKFRNAFLDTNVFG